ncbi:MAG: NAD-dependent deacylase [Nitrospinae bacterium]|nr:NAD-dependent deacylase [Nitrospinota bacterium]
MDSRGLNLPEKVVRALQSARNAAVLTGAGVSAESGIPTFRGAGGLWNNYRAEDLATPEAFERDPELVWRWYDWRRGIIASKTPNPGHYALAQMEGLFENFTLITQNVDGLHAKAGNRRILELHGNIWRLRCIAEGTVREDHDVPLTQIPPRCQNCGAMERPGIVWFGESLEPRIIGGAFDAARKAELFIVAGTSGVVQPAAGLAGVARKAGAVVIEINLERTPISYNADVTLTGQSGGIESVLNLVETKV